MSKVYHVIALNRLVIGLAWVGFSIKPRFAMWKSDLTYWRWSHHAVSWLGLGIGVTYHPKGQLP